MVERARWMADGAADVGGAARGWRRGLVAGMLAAGTVAGCTTLDRHTIGGYTAAQLAAVTKEAREECEAQRGPGHLPPHEFTTDGCSLFFDGSWQDCCVKHDKKYWCGGTRRQRGDADRELCDCVGRASSPLLGQVVRLAVRMGGAPWMPFWFRWGYGWDYPKPYDDAKP